jgi:hypothetical protein
MAFYFFSSVAFHFTMNQLAKTICGRKKTIDAAPPEGVEWVK